MVVVASRGGGGAIYQQPKRGRHGDDGMQKTEREGFLILRKVVRKAVKGSRFLNGTGTYGVYVRLCLPW